MHQLSSSSASFPPHAVHLSRVAAAEKSTIVPLSVASPYLSQHFLRQCRVGILGCQQTAGRPHGYRSRSVVKTWAGCMATQVVRLNRVRDHDLASVEGKVDVSEVELEYERRLRAMSPAEKMARSAAMFAWTRQQMARRIRIDQPSLTDEQVKWQVALKLYEREPEVVKLIQEHLSRVSS